MKTNSNSYTIIYSVIIVVIVAFLLAFVFQALKPMQDANVALDKKKQILNSLNIRDLNDAQADAKYKEVVVADRVIDEKGKVLLPGTSGGENAGFKLESKDYKEGKLALYICRVNGETKYVVPVYGMGLWGPISGYIALNADKSTVYGVYFNHESETAGLGAEIKDNKAWQEKFQGKKLFKNGDDKAIALSVEKKVEDPTTQVDAVTGATLTSNGVRDMLHEALGKYLVFINQK
ncbi:MAG: NADH:ubiquinone reductase (Na(+)-transporting) subunit C [Prevotella salivae]|jgi:NADH:ubiquinone oxidoreductase, Na(+)-translocating, C subunit|uniref:NADH:ubiquinone reductase (Na(+)-transporting) subunit C n=1 Tax=Segatella salivae TaxID=228604 RepID=UPI001CB32F12|nr:NADH:ubiquinone reductase (Na(+)-transporting) subunit C [Segatella salivae]MBF1521625.1 NADH:ubiquinone reductase (Na(+)-transporting) subunit C [Segatella salivae]MBF1541094.1 NADH:ubiquinone reductase (Na(+)-transporting) subunit C [Segatella salivae]MBF1565665.1 NADH:ubiquinone reductase (Na(+)-transporting) subunit C [Segatella salivae]